MKISGIAQSIQTQQAQKKGRKSDAAPVQQNNDKVEISSEARQLAKSNDLSAVATKAAKEAPDIRSDKINEARERVAQGFYNQENIASVIADKLLQEFGI